MAACLSQPEDAASAQHSLESACEDEDDWSQEGEDVFSQQEEASDVEKWLAAGGRAALEADIGTVNRFGYLAR